MISSSLLRLEPSSSLITLCPGTCSQHSNGLVFAASGSTICDTLLGVY